MKMEPNDIKALIKAYDIMDAIVKLPCLIGGGIITYILLCDVTYFFDTVSSISVIIAATLFVGLTVVFAALLFYLLALVIFILEGIFSFLADLFRFLNRKNDA
ncbi:hypothetical protein IJ090_02845 [Candidatus Saccharibacteria bacterium]|nr:hypothetical protein [Candidatus Saccharibacteria bacterium]